MAAAVIRAVACALAAPAALAQPLADPTLPPIVAASAAAPQPAPAPDLRFTLRGADGAFSAWLAGRWLRAGETVDLDGMAFRVERVTADAIELTRGGERTAIEMAPRAVRAVQRRDGDRSPR